MRDSLSGMLIRLLILAALIVTTAPPIAAATPVSGEEGGADLTARLELAGDYLDRLEAIGFRGAVLVAKDDHVLIEQGYGWTDATQSERIGPETLFAIGSNTKPFTAAAILTLQDEGKLSVQDRIGRFLPDVPPDKGEITIHQLLTHSTGFNHSGIFEGDDEQIDRDDAVRRILASDLLFAPGSQSSYADANTILLAAIVELASGQPFETYLRENLFRPAGMAHTGFHGDDPAALGQTQAVGMVEGKEVGTPAELPALSWALMGAGGMVSSVADLYRWHQAVATGEILSPASGDAYASPHVPLGPDSSEGYGWVIAEPQPGHRLRASGGSTDEIGHVNVIDWWLDDDLLVIASSADASYSAEDLTPAIERILFGMPQELPPAMVEVSPEALQEVAGRYALPDDGAIVVTAAEDRLLLSPEGEAGFAALFPPDDEQPDQHNTIAYLESGQEASLEPWKDEQEKTLGPFRRMRVVGSAAPEGGDEVWTYVAFEFQDGSMLTRWVVTEDGVLLAAEVPSEPPTVMLLPTSDQTFTSFGLGQETVLTATFGRDASGRPTLEIEPPSGEALTALQA